MTTSPGSMQKYFADKGGSAHGGELSWPGTAAGFPVRGPVGDLRQSEINQLPHTLDYKSRAFQLWDPEQHAEFNTIMDRIVNGWYKQHKRYDNWDAQHNGMHVWLEWVQIYGELIVGKTPGVHHVPK